MKKIVALLISFVLLFSGCGTAPEKTEINNENDSVFIELSDSAITVNGSDITSDSTQPVYSSNDIVFYLAGQDFTYGEGKKEDEHEQIEADAHTVVHITKPGRYVLSGTLSLGQIAIDLGEDSETDPNAVVTLILNNVDINCKVAPAIIFYNVYECCSSDEETATKDVDTRNAGANVIIADDSENNINGSYVAKIYKSYELSEDGNEVVDSKKLHKYDGAFYSKKTMNISGGDKGNGILNINAENEGLDSELHLTINGGIINITSGNDGINTNEDNVSVTTINGGTLNIICNGSSGEGDGIDSNGWLVINGGTVTAQACSSSGDAGIDSDKGIHINGGKVIASGNMLDRIADSNQTYVVFGFAGFQQGGNTYTLKNSADKVVYEYTPENDFTYLLIAGDELTPDDYTFWQENIQLSGSKTQNMQGGMIPVEKPQMPSGEQGAPHEIPEGMEIPEKPNGNIPQDGRSEILNGDMQQDVRPGMPGGEKPEIPDDMIPPDNEGGIMGGNMIPGKELSTIFTLTEGENQFFDVAYAAE